MWDNYAVGIRRIEPTVTVTVNADRGEPAGHAGPTPRTPALSDVELPDRFTPISMLGAGAMGYVVGARDGTLGREVAVKVISSKRLGDGRSRDRFLREARAVAALNHQNIVTVYDLDPLGKFLVMELIRGETLKQRIERGGPLPVEQVKRIGTALLSALAAAHEAGIVHRDVKPANLLLGDDGSVKLADFGVAATTDSELTGTGEVLGTPAYMAPEQLRGLETDLRCDVYAAGATLYEAATGQRLHRRPDRSDDLQRKIATTIADPHVAAAISRAVCERPEDRFPSAREFAHALLMQPPKPRRLRRALMIAAPLILLVAVGIALGRGGGHDASSVQGTEETASEIELGVAALERQDFAAAKQHLLAADQRQPEVHYYLGLLYWWTSGPAISELDKALVGGLDERTTAVAKGIRSVVNLEYPQVISTFEELDRRYPDDREVLYGRFEAMFHGGHETEALDVYRRLRKVAPRFSLGLHHVLSYWLARGDLEDAKWALQVPTGDALVWQSRFDVAAGDFGSAIHRLEAANQADPDVARELAAAYIASGNYEKAHDLAVGVETRLGVGPLLALSLARGLQGGTSSPDYLWALAMNAASVPAKVTGGGIRDPWMDLAALIVIDGNPERAQKALQSLYPAEQTRWIEVATARAMLSATIADQDGLRKFVETSPFPEVRELAAAALAELAGDYRAAATSWRKVIELEGFGRFRIAQSVHLARVLNALGDDGAIAPCEYVVHPKLFHWSWGAGVGECLQIIAEAQRRAGRITESQEASRQQLELRAAAPPGDALASAARANLAR